jgi:hypothetical protein
MYMFDSKDVQDWSQTCTCLGKDNLLFSLIYGQWDTNLCFENLKLTKTFIQIINYTYICVSKS